MVDLPFKESFLGDGSFRRIFNSDLNDSDLKWHWDEEDRILEFTSDNDWEFQFDNELPIPCSGMIYVKKGRWHRIIKGSGSLEVVVTKHPSSRDI